MAILIIRGLKRLKQEDYQEFQTILYSTPYYHASQGKTMSQNKIKYSITEDTETLKSPDHLGTATFAYNPSTEVVEAIGSQVQTRPGLLKEFKVRLSK